MNLFGYTVKLIVCSILIICSAIVVAVIGTYLVVKPTTPDLNAIRNIEIEQPLRVYTKDKKFLAEFSERRSQPIKYAEIPAHFTSALLAAEDNNFFDHTGVDLKGLGRAVYEAIKYQDFKTGGSTLTMQLVKLLLLSDEKNIRRKVEQILLALELEKELTKEEIFELYINTVFFGHRAYGLAAASNVYFNKNFSDLSIAQYAILAGLPQAPSRANPITSPGAAVQRRNWILSRMYSLGRLSHEQYNEAIHEPLNSEIHIPEAEIYAPYIAEMARDFIVHMFGEKKAYNGGYTIYTSIDSRLQTQANQSLKNGLMAYDRKHGFRGAEAKLETSEIGKWTKQLSRFITYNDIEPAVVYEVNDAEKFIVVMRKNGEYENIDFETMRWTNPYKHANSMGVAPSQPSSVVKIGDIVRIYYNNDRWNFGQIPEVQGALVSMNPTNGEIQSLVGGFSFEQTKFNRATQARRQPGSSFKPFIYAAALDNGLTASSILYDEPIKIIASDGKLWQPKNDTEDFLGPIRLREALYRSRNLAAIRVITDIGIEKAAKYVERFGFDPKYIPVAQSLVLGTADLTPLEVATGWAVFANGGFKIEPYFIDKILDREGRVVYQTSPVVVNHEDAEKQAPSVLDARTAYIITDILKDVINRGTGRKALALKRTDIAGKTGTTNEAKDLWFSGYNPDYVTTVWTGFDQPSTMGKREYAATVPLPIWVDYMRKALEDKPIKQYQTPAGIVRMPVSIYSGKRSHYDASYVEIFKNDNLPGWEERIFTTNDSNALDVF